MFVIHSVVAFMQWCAVGVQ